MSQYPSTPSFGGSLHQAHQWNFHQPPVLNPPNFYDPSNTMLPPAPGMSNFAVPQGSQLPGLGIPPSFPSNNLENSSNQVNDSVRQFAQSTQPHSQSGPAFHAFNGKVGGADQKQRSDSRHSHMEEGEVSDLNGSTAARFSANHGASQNASISDRFPTRAPYVGSARPTNGVTFDRPSVSQSEQGALSGRMEDVAHGAATPEAPQPVRDGTESPYDPPLTISIVGNEQQNGVVSEGDGPPALSKASNSPDNSTSHTNENVAARLRLKAKGALLSLAPHNIRFNELVQENIDPTILRQLYEEVGIKTSSPLSTTSAAINQTSNVAASVEVPSSTSVQGAPSRFHPTSTSAQPTAQGVPATTTSDINNAGKQPERKELIARMLAAKAKKVSEPADQPKIAATETAPSTTGSGTTKAQDHGPAATSSSGAPQPRPKNQAQTELARQRMELLKKQGLTKKPQTPSSTSTPSQLNASAAPESQTRPLPAQQHPLPERPPVPIPPRTGSLPGLSLTQSLPPGHQKEADKNITGSQPASRKRPGALDFDDFSTKQRKPVAAEERLVIDISSDDESLYGEDTQTSATRARQVGPSAPPTAPPFPNRQRQATSTTPQTPVRDTRALDLEIQEMHRRIAEAEKRKAQARSATLTSTDRTADSAVSRPINEQAENKGTLPESSTAQPQPSMELADVGPAAREKILRKRKLEALDAELSATEARLAETKREQEKLAAELAKAREARKLLVEELENLVAETETRTREGPTAVEEDREDQRSTQDPVSPCATAETSPSEEAAPKDAAPTAESPTIVDDVNMKPERTDSAPKDDKMGHPPSGPGVGAESGDLVTPTSAPSTDERNDPSSMIPSDRPPIEEREGSEMSVDETTSDDEEDGEISDDSLSESQLEPSAIDDADGVHVNSSVDESQDESEASEPYEPPEPTLPSLDTKPQEPRTETREDGVEQAADYRPSSPSTSSGEELIRTVQGPISRATSKFSLLDNDRPRDSSLDEFTPYVSPLRYFRSYRFHPKFLEDCASGFESLTYSHEIDPMKALCPYEAAGGICNDGTCEFQHWRDMAISGDKILIQLGSQREGQTPEEKERYTEGLKEVINESQRNGVNEFGAVAKAIVDYRRRFLADPSRVLAL